MDKVVIGNAELWHGDCQEVLPKIGLVNAVVTSPPYDALRDYGSKGSLPIDCIPLIAEKIESGGVVMWNCADQVIDGSESGTSFRHALAFMDAGMRLHDTMIYCKEGVTFPDQTRYHPAFEYMFVFSNGKPKCFNGIRDWKNKWGGSKMHGTDRLADGTTKVISGPGRDIPMNGLRRNWWIISNPFTEDIGHPAPMPLSMAGDHIQTWTNGGDVVLDPYLGSGTCGIAALNLGRKFIGIEIHKKYFDIACMRIENAQKQERMFA